ncbi:phage virion morphogenesis protein [Flammeovirga sp. OC4]|uniref:phage virion morphogenesis protein n=1 Tax=Flammeovirga sp. OC4 TaxID=1382345 RepID=UPI0005C74714|nr:phage virion morphogenesis protein [Flammeovirga sp. OC4]
MAKHIFKLELDLKQHSKAIETYLKKDAPRKMGIEAKKHYRKSFDDGGFTDSYLEKWKPAKRTNSNSVWYGFEYRAKSTPPDSHPKRWKAKKGYEARKPNAITNYSPAATKRTTLVGTASTLKNSIKYRSGNGEVRIFSTVHYAKLHNEGGTIKVFGKTTRRLPQRKFMGKSNKLNARIKFIIKKDINQLLK